ncbi:putative holin-like toxin [Pectinatus brassicae]
MFRFFLFGGRWYYLTTFQTLSLMISFASLIVLVISCCNTKK